MSDDEPKDESTGDSEQQSDQEPAESDQPSAQSDAAPVDGDQSPEQSDGQPAEQADQSEQQPEEQPTDSDQLAEQTEGKPADSDQPVEQPQEQPTETDQPLAQSEGQLAESDQSAPAADTDNVLAFAGGEASPGGGAGGAGGGSGSSKTTKVQVIAIFMTNAAGSSFKKGSISMKVFDGAKGNLLWRLGSMDQQQKLTYQDAALKSNIIHSGTLPVSPGDNVKVELLVRLFGPDHELLPETIPQVDFGTAAVFKVPADGTLTVAGDVERTNKEFTVDAKDESSARDAARRMLASKEEMQLAMVESALDVGAGRFTVDFWIPTKRIRIVQPKPLEVIY
jgi:hypothetical protein